MNNKKATENLLAAIATLETVPDEQFNMAHWWLEDGRAFDDDRNVMYKVADGPCGCAVGHLIQRGLLSGEVLKPEEVPSGALPYEYRDRIFVQITAALEIWNYKVAEFLFDHYSYSPIIGKITRQHVIRRMHYIISEMASEQEAA